MPTKQHQPDYFTQLLKGTMARTTDDMEGCFNAKILKIKKVKDEVFADVQPLVKVDKKKGAIVGDCRFIYQPIRYEKIKSEDSFTADYTDDRGGNHADGTIKPDGKAKYPSESYEAKLHYKVGDCVLCVVLKHDDDNFNSKPKAYNSSTERQFDVGASYIVGKIATKKDMWKEV